MNKIHAEAHWRDSARPVKLFAWDAKAVFPLVFCLIFPALWTLALAVLTIIFFAVLNRYGFSIAVFSRWLRTTLAGNRKIAKPWWSQ